MIRKLSHEEIQNGKPTEEQVCSFERTPVFIVLDNIRSLYNVGAMFRTCEAILAEKMFLCGITGRPPRKEIEKVALGAEKLVPWEYNESVYDVVSRLKNNGVKICALELTEPSFYFKKAPYDFPIALVAGNEVEGISEEIMPLVDMAVSIPMLGRANSLNVATALGIAAYELLHQYKYGSEKSA